MEKDERMKEVAAITLASEETCLSCLLLTSIQAVPLWSMFKKLVLYVLVCAVFSLWNSSPFAQATGLETFAKESHRQRQQVSSASSPWSPFSQWHWLDPVLSFRENRLEDDETSSSLREANPPLESTGNDDSTLSLVLFLDGSEEERARNEESKISVTPPALMNFSKRSKMCLNLGKARCRRGEVSMIPAAQVRQTWEDDYSSVPDVLIQFSQKQAEETACNDLSVQLFRVYLKEHYLEPMWIRDIGHLGMCPSKLQTRRFGEHVFPSSIVETKCLCNDKACSNLGGDFRCQDVRRPIRTWVRHEEKFMPVQEMITVGCVCVQRTSPEGRDAKPVVDS
ncbi:hypothetical protein SK128_010714 [Halocaridina rubra]|uniref:Uncharacterized protein n=1 Tax=Halocaridina rubra TaxID=373956 RepID=A0AAN8XSW2_HALRR